jgi:hypothetical protein
MLPLRVGLEEATAVIVGVCGANVKVSALLEVAL